MYTNLSIITHSILSPIGEQLSFCCCHQGKSEKNIRVAAKIVCAQQFGNVGRIMKQYCQMPDILTAFALRCNKSMPLQFDGTSPEVYWRMAELMNAYILCNLSK